LTQGSPGGIIGPSATCWEYEVGKALGDFYFINGSQTNHISELNIIFHPKL